MERTCKLESNNTEHLGVAAVSSDEILQLVVSILAEKTVNGNISSMSQERLNNLCFSARFAGSVDDLAFVEGMEKANLTVDCTLCEHHR